MITTDFLFGLMWVMLGCVMAFMVGYYVTGVTLLIYFQYAALAIELLAVLLLWLYDPD